MISEAKAVFSEANRHGNLGGDGGLKSKHMKPPTETVEENLCPPQNRNFSDWVLSSEEQSEFFFSFSFFLFDSLEKTMGIMPRGLIFYRRQTALAYSFNMFCWHLTWTKMSNRL